MEDLSAVSLLEKFGKRLDVLHAPLRVEAVEGPLPPGPPAVPPAGLLRLPFEIRLQIYHYCIPRKYIIDVMHPRFYTGWLHEEADYTSDLEVALDFDDDTVNLEDTLCFEDDAVNSEAGAVHSGSKWEGDYWNRPNKNSIFLLSKQISQEALDILYGENIFKLHLHGQGEYYLKKNFAEANRQRMRYLLLIAQPMGVSFQSGKPDNALWPSLLPKLKVFRIVAQQPTEASSYYGAPPLEQEMNCWVKWIRPFLQCFGQHLSRTSTVEVDIDGREETMELVKECLLHGYREIRCRHVGDLIFKRGRFSWESGYWNDDSPINSRDADGDWGSD